jgi:mRNA-degrading endonuclease RelE of RelBE toxin-antitoxin system
MREMAGDPFQGDIIKLEGAEGCYRRRVGNYRIFFRVDRAGQTVGVSAIARRTSTTY